MLYNKEVKQIKEKMINQIIGNYLKGAGENAAYLKEVKASNLGAVFLNYGEKIDLIEDVLVDYNKANPKMQSAGTLSLLIKETCDKIDAFAMKCETMEYPKDVVKRDLTKYANSLLDGVNIVAFSEGESDIDLKSDIKVLLREGREEFNKRIEEEEKEIEEAQAKATADPTSDGEVAEDTPEEDVEDDSDFIEEEDETTEETPEDDSEEEGTEEDEESDEDDTDYDKLAQDEYGSDKEENEDDDIPTGESYFSFGEDGAGVLKSIKNTVKSITGSIAKYWHDISEKARIANEKAKQPRSYSTISPEEKEVQRQKSLDSFNEWFNKYISEMTPYLNSKNEDTCWGSYELVRKFLDDIYYDPATALTYGYAYNDVLDIVHDGIVTLNKNFIKHMKDTFDVDLSDQVTDKSSGAGESFRFRKKTRHNHNKAFGENVMTDMLRKVKANMNKTAEEKAAEKETKNQLKKEQKLNKFLVNVDDYLTRMDEFLLSSNEATCDKAYDMISKFLYDTRTNPYLKTAYPDIIEDIINAIYEREDKLEAKYIKHLEDEFGIDFEAEYGSGESFMFKRKSGYTTIDPQAFEEMVKILLETESDTLKAFSESKGISYIAESEDYAITSKTIINTTAVVLAARYKFGFYN